MHLQSLELFGFKSFAEKTQFNFHEGVTAIVGPNGCGKSNVLDAVRWVLGEQSAKALRGGEMADVIFNGTDSRKPLGFAEVSLTFSDCAAELGVDWHEVRVTRRVFRDGNSEYLLNKSVCRLKDIQDLFADTGVGRSAYSIMEQGKIDLILSSRPEDRRTVFEEAAGITKYKGQKREALRKLEATEANLLRVGDIIKEVKRQIGSLQRQAGKARRYQTLLADLQVLDTHHSRRKLEELEREAEQSREKIARAENSERETLQQVETAESRLTNRRVELDRMDAEVTNARAETQRLQNAIATHRSRIEFNRQRSEEIGELIGRSRDDIAAAETKRAEQASQIQEADSLIEKNARLLEDQQHELAGLNEKLSALRNDRAEREAELQTLQVSLSKNENRLDSIEQEIAGTRQRLETTAARLGNLKMEIQDATRVRAEERVALEHARVASENEQRSVESLFEAAQVSEQQLQALQDSLGQIENDAHRLERAIAEKESRLEILRQLRDEGEGLAKGSQAILKGLDAPEKIRPALGGALAASLQVERDFVAAIEAALGRNLQAIVLQQPELAPEILRHISEHSLGQAALAMPQLAATAHDDHLVDLPDDSLGWAFEKAHSPEALQPLVRRLLRGVVLVRDLESALRLKPQFPMLQFATLAGEFVSTAGIVFGGSGSNATTSLLGRNALIVETEREIGECKIELREIATRREQTAADVDDAKKTLAAARQRHQAAHFEQSNSATQILLLQHRVEAAEEKLQQLQRERGTLEQQISAAELRIAQLEAELAKLQTTVAEERAQKVAATENEEQARLREAEVSEAVQALRLAVATEKQRRESLVAQRAPMTTRAAELTELIEKRGAEIANYERRLELQERESSEAQNAIEAETQELAIAEEQVRELAANRAKHNSSVAELETELRELRNSLNHLHDLRGQEQVRQTQLQLRIENLVEHITRRYQLDLRGFETDVFAFEKTLRVQLKRRETDENANEKSETNLADIDQVIAELTRQLDGMGPVNLDAVSEYDELEERFRFLETQNNDLTAARKELLDVIARINSTTQKLFAETFAQVRINFREVFAELFGGGRADLALVDESNPLECGIDIIAKPPGKQLQSVSLLSGGERTMTAVALLFAIYMVRPSPFCILDEMDAPLDESNINRFIKMLDRFVEQSQFIIITHNKRTIAKADVLYGVTMEERGVSKLVGMKLAAEKGADGELKRTAREENPPPQFSSEQVEERELALSR